MKRFESKHGEGEDVEDDPWVISHINVHRACFYAKAKRRIFIRLPPELDERFPGHHGVLRKATYGGTPPRLGLKYSLIDALNPPETDSNQKPTELIVAPPDPGTYAQRFWSHFNVEPLSLEINSESL